MSDRSSLKRGDATKLIFEFECEDENGKITITSERMYVIAAEIIDDKYISILDSQPKRIDKN